MIHDPRSKKYVNRVDDGIIKFFRGRILSWRPSRRLEYAMEKSVLILSDTELVTGLGILIAGYTQLTCGISAYHWQIMVYIAWLISFSFLSAMAFLQDYFRSNNNMRVIRISFMVILAALLITALVPTGSIHFLNILTFQQGYYPGMAAACYYKQIAHGTFLQSGSTRAWSMVISILVVAISYIHCGVRLFDPWATTSHKYLRSLPGTKFKHGLRFLEEKSKLSGLRGIVWRVVFMNMVGVFAVCRATFDIASSMFLEVIWLSLAMSWGTIKIWNTKAISLVSIEGYNVSLNRAVIQEEEWSFGQMLPLLLVLLPLLSMAQAYLDNDAKAQDALERSERLQDTAISELAGSAKAQSPVLSEVQAVNLPDDGSSDIRRANSDSIRRCNQHTSNCPESKPEGTMSNTNEIYSTLTSTSITPGSRFPRYPYDDFTESAWYHDHITLLLGQILMLASFILWLFTNIASVAGLSSLIRNRVFVIWVLGIIPLASWIHLATWLLASYIVRRRPSIEDWFKGKGKYEQAASNEAKWWHRITLGKVSYWFLRMFLISFCLMFTFWVSVLCGSAVKDLYFH